MGPSRRRVRTKLRRLIHIVSATSKKPATGRSHGALYKARINQSPGTTRQRQNAPSVDLFYRHRCPVDVEILVVACPRPNHGLVTATGLLVSTCTDGQSFRLAPVNCTAQPHGDMRVLSLTTLIDQEPAPELGTIKPYAGTTAPCIFNTAMRHVAALNRAQQRSDTLTSRCHSPVDDKIRYIRRKSVRTLMTHPTYLDLTLCMHSKPRSLKQTYPGLTPSRRTRLEIKWVSHSGWGPNSVISARTGSQITQKI